MTATHNFSARAPDQLTFFAGAVITNVYMDPSGWWEGDHNGRRGKFPNTYVKEIGLPVPPADPVPLPPPTPGAALPWWHWDVDSMRGIEWDLHKTGALSYYVSMVKNSNGVIVPAIYEIFRDVAHKLGFDPNLAVSVFAVSNKALLGQFDHWRISTSHQHKSSPGLFFKDDWRTLPNPTQRTAFRDALSSKRFWEETNKVGAIPMLQGASSAVLQDICLQGFQRPATTDPGYFGSGIYFTSNVSYAASYSKSDVKGKPILVSMVAPGNAFPVTEAPVFIVKDATGQTTQRVNPQGYYGKPGRAGYQSHYTVVDKTNLQQAFPVTGAINTDTTADELVVFEPAQTVPVFYFYLPSTFK